MGAFLNRKSGCQAAHALGSSGQHSLFCACFARDNTRLNVLDRLLIEPAAFSVMDRAYLDYRRLRRFTIAGAFFVTRAKRNLRCTIRDVRPVDRTTGLRSDHTIVLNGIKTATLYPESLRRRAFYDVEHKRRIVFITNNFAIPALTIAGLYKCRWQIELFFKWIKQHLRIKAFFGTSDNAVKTQIWIAISVYVLVAIVKKELGVQRSLYEILQVLSLTLFEKTPLFQALQAEIDASKQDADRNQLKLFEL